MNLRWKSINFKRNQRVDWFLGFLLFPAVIVVNSNRDSNGSVNFNRISQRKRYIPSLFYELSNAWLVAPVTVKFTLRNTAASTIAHLLATTACYCSIINAWQHVTNGRLRMTNERQRVIDGRWRMQDLRPILRFFDTLTHVVPPVVQIQCLNGTFGCWVIEMLGNAYLS